MALYINTPLSLNKLYSKEVRKKARERVNEINKYKINNNEVKPTKITVKKIYPAEYDNILNKIKNIL